MPPHDSTMTYCGGCGCKLAEPSDLPAEDRKPCDNCGSTARSFGVRIVEGMRIDATVRPETIQVRADVPPPTIQTESIPGHQAIKGSSHSTSGSTSSVKGVALRSTIEFRLYFDPPTEAEGGRVWLVNGYLIRSEDVHIAVGFDLGPDLTHALLGVVQQIADRLKGGA